MMDFTVVLGSLLSECKEGRQNDRYNKRISKFLVNDLYIKQGL